MAFSPTQEVLSLVLINMYTPEEAKDQIVSQQPQKEARQY
jgi:hypothetical protein